MAFINSMTCYAFIFVNAHRKICKRIDTAVVFTQKYSRVSYLSTGNAKCSSKDQGHLRIKIEKCFVGREGFSRIKLDK